MKTCLMEFLHPDFFKQDGRKFPGGCNEDFTKANYNYRNVRLFRALSQ